MLTDQYISDDVKNVPYPKEFREKARHLLKFIYDKGGKDFIEMKLTAVIDYPLCYADDINEFIRIVDFLVEKKYWLEYKKVANFALGNKAYIGVTLTESGIDEVERDLPKVPMVGLVEQRIDTGDEASDNRIKHTIRLFTTEPVTIENMRSACQALAYELEPLRDELTKYGYFTSKDTNDFF
ncbi:hypothetical protein GCM10028805_38280 [Spirosoma harenae]